jgi:hypothetical protein
MRQRPARCGGRDPRRTSLTGCAEARARGITLLVNRAPYSIQELRQAVDLISGGRERLRQLGFDLQAIAGPTPEFFGLTVMGALLGDEEAKQLPRT